MSVVDSLAKVAEQLPGIGKDQRASQQQGGYAYRGIERIIAEAGPLLAAAGVVFVPQVLSCEIRDITVAEKPWTDTILTVRYRICGTDGPDDFVEATVVGIGRDNADKGANKALTQAFKYALLQTLLIADEKDDTDGTTHEADTPARTARPASHDAPDETPLPEGFDSLDGARAAIDTISGAVNGLGDEDRAAFLAWKQDQQFPYPWPADACDAMLRELERIANANAASYGDEEPF